MGNPKKRRCYTGEEKIRRKIRKLEEKLSIKEVKRRRIIESSDSETEAAITAETEATYVLLSGLEPTPVVASTSTAQEPAPLAIDPAVENLDAEIELESDILELLGDAPKSDVILGPAVHKDIATRWQDILIKGLQKETKEKLLEDYLAPSNCDLLLPPDLNPETKVALPESLLKRDSSILAKQKQLGIALSALAMVMDRVVRKDTKQNILKPLSDACRILCDSHFCETRTRRNFVLGAVNSSLKETLQNTNRDKYLFGENVSEKLKSAKVIQRSADDLKAPAQKLQFNKHNFAKKSNTLNSQHRKTQARGEARAPLGGFTQYRQATKRTLQEQDQAPPHLARSSPPPPRKTTSARR